MNAYFIDLDGTLIFSHRYYHEGYKPVEIYKDRQISFIERDTLTALEDVINCGEFIPITSRTKAQYERIGIFKENCPQYALLDNGGILLVNGIEDSLWEEETKRLLNNSLETLNDITAWAEQYADVKIQDGIVVFIKTADDGIREEVIKGLNQYEGFYWFMHGEKLYVCSELLTKGAAIKRFKNRFSVEKSIAAGDSEVDFSMIDHVDIFVTDERNRELINSEKVIFTEQRDVARTALKMK